MSAIISEPTAELRRLLPRKMPDPHAPPVGMPAVTPAAQQYLRILWPAR